MRSHARDPQPGATVDSVLRQALGDPSVTVAYWIAAARQWVTAEGGAPDDVDRTHVEPTRHGQPVARVGFDPDRCDPELVRAVANEALPALETTGLRAALALELLEVQASRARIVQAQLGERQRIERDLHDGAQQRLLAMAMELQAALVNGDATRLRQAAQVGVDQAKATVRELRELANGLHPAALTDGGLAAAVEDLARRVPGPLDLYVDETRYPRAVEGTAWFIVCEAVANAMKHAAGARVRVDVEPVGACVLVRVSDDGPGIADPDGGGLRGLADRAAAVGGRLTVRSSDSGHRCGGGAAVRVVIADDSVLLREGLQRLLAEAGVETCAIAGDADELERLVEEHRPDVAIIDIRMPPTYTHEGAQAAGRLRDRWPDLGLLLLSQSMESRYAAELADSIPRGSATS